MLNIEPITKNIVLCGKLVTALDPGRYGPQPPEWFLMPNRLVVYSDNLDLRVT